MEIKTIKLILSEHLKTKKIFIDGDDNHFNIIVVSQLFENLSNVKRHQMVYAPLMKYISNNDIHAISIKAYSLSEWTEN